MATDEKLQKQGQDLISKGHDDKIGGASQELGAAITGSQHSKQLGRERFEKGRAEIKSGNEMKAAA